MSKVREDIIETADRLFVERGFDKVSLRDIAKELDIYHSNVTYYFSTKEELIAEVVGGVYDELFKTSLTFGPDNTVEALLDRFKTLDSELKEYAPYVLGAESLSREYSSIKKRVTRFRRWYSNYYHESFQELEDAGLFRSDIPALYLEIISYHMPIIASSNEFSGKKMKNEKGQSLFAVLCAYIFPLLSPKGIKAWNKYFDKKK